MHWTNVLPLNYTFPAFLKTFWSVEFSFVSELGVQLCCFTWEYKLTLHLSGWKIETEQHELEDHF